jgi:hypothetical protein
MRTRLLFALGLIATLAIAVSACSRNQGPTASARGAFANPLAPAATPLAPDSIPPGPPPPRPHPGPKPPIPAVVFVSADSASAPDSVDTRWQLGNDSHKPFTMPWTLTSSRNWPGFPKSGTVALAAKGTQLLVVAVLVPDTAAAGPAPLRMTVTRSDGSTAAADGAIQVGTATPPDSTGAQARSSLRR